MVSPALVVVTIAVVAPILWLIFVSFRDLRLRNLRQDGLFGAEFTLDNFAEVLTGRGLFSALWTTVVYSLTGTLLAVAIGTIAALAVRKPFRGRSLVRGLMLLPYVAPVVGVTYVWSTMLDPNLGVVNATGTDVLGWDRAIPFLSLRASELSIGPFTVTVPVALLTVIAFQAWRYFPFCYLFVLARLQAVPGELDEAARLDGASPLQRFWYITFPQLRGVIGLLIVLRLIWTFNEFDDIYLLTGGGAGTEVASVRIYNYLVGRGDIGASSAMAVVLAALLALLLLLYFKFVRRSEDAS